ncbi:organoarsenical effux MFS transporter ArsJ [Cellvibrio sp. NN19]|uniref:organoarsenical effux MFS transporter ArsJ n=1 Tax=Cellvibrio chitinivorans TaxID=3102792 RepID=UPI002B416220|nr:organoarsenical effux MFS transporter ArsJ [Cellvibrio sp. NN19]
MISSSIKQYAIVTGNYWAFTLTDGALRMLVVLHFHQLGYSPLAIASLFLFYEFFGVVTNLFGGYLGARIGLNRTMNIGLGLQVIALALLAVPTSWLSVPLVMGAQALSGVAKDLNKMSAKSAIKQLLPGDQQGRLFKWIALLTGSKNALKGVGFFLGGLLLATVGFKTAVILMAAVLALVWMCSVLLLQQDLGKAKNKPKFSELFSKSRAINFLSAARLFLFGARDIWFVVALPVFLSSQLQWDFWQTGGFLASWVIGYGIVQSLVPFILRSKHQSAPGGTAALGWASVLAAITAALAIAITTYDAIETILISGLIIFGIVFAINSSLHSYLIVSYAKDDGVSLDVGFYYMANALGRLVGTLLSGYLYQQGGLSLCLWGSAIFLLLVVFISMGLPNTQTKQVE